MRRWTLSVRLSAQLKLTDKEKALQCELQGLCTSLRQIVGEDEAAVSLRPRLFQGLDVVRVALSKARHSDNFSCTVSEYGFEGKGVVSSGADGITGHGLPLGSITGKVAPQPVNITLKSRILALPKSLALGCGTQSFIFLILETGGFSICILQGAKIALQVVG